MASDAFGLNTLTTPQPDVKPRDVVIIHGLYGSHHSNWADVNRKYVKFLKDYRLSFYTYDVFGSNGGVLTRSGARDEATRLLDSLVKLRGNDSKTANIIFIAHDIGGSLVKEAVVLSQQRKYQDIYRSISVLAFFGCPHRGLKDDLQPGCTEILMSHGRTTFAEARKLAGPLVEWALEAGDSFAETRLSTMVEIYNVASSHSDSKQRVFGRWEVSLPIGSYMQRVVFLVSKLAHKDLLGSSNNPNLRWAMYARNNPLANGKIRPHVHSFLSQTAPQYAFGTPYSNRLELATVRAGLRDLMSSDGPGLHLVHVSGAPGYRAAEVAEHLYKWTDARGNAFGSGSTAFFFDPTDCRYDSAEAMLCTLLTQYCSDGPFWQRIEEILKPLDISRDWQVEDLYAVAADFLLQLLALEREPESCLVEVTHTVILGNLDGRIRNGSWLVRKLQETIADCDLRFKIIVTSSDPASLAAEWTSTSTYGPLQGSDNHWDETALSILKGVLAIVQKQPQLHSCDIAALRQLAQSCGSDTKLLRMTSDWLKDGQLVLEDQQHSFISQLMARSWTASLLERVLFAFRPLTLSELLDLERLGWPKESPDGLPRPCTMEELRGRLRGGLLMIRRQEVHLAHPDLRDYLLLASKDNALGGWLALDSEASVHGRIAVSCLQYLTCPEKRQLMRHRASESGSWHTPFERRDDFLSYAVKYWLRHATRAANEGVFESDACTRFLADDDAVRLWVALYRAPSAPLTPGEGPASAGPLSSLAIFAEHGAEDLLIPAVRKHQKLGTRDLNTACLAALVAAAGQGNLRMVKELMEIPMPEGETLDQAVLAAIESGNVDVFADIINAGRQVPGRIRDFASLLARAASLGRTEAVRGLLDIMKASNAPMTVSKGLSPLSYACQRGFAEIVDLLIREGGPSVLAELKERNTSVSKKSDKGPTPLPIRLAVEFDRLDILDTLRSAVAEQPREPEAIAFYRCLIKESARFGRRKPVQRALDYLRRSLRRDDQPAASDASDDDSILIDYLVGEVIGGYMDKYNRPAIRLDLLIGLVNGTRGYDGDYPSVVEHAIATWPQAFDVVNLLTSSKDRISQGDFRSAFAKWMGASVKSADLRVVKLVFENGAKSPWATTEVLRFGATTAFAEALPDDRLYLCVPYLLEKGADITSRIMYGRTPLLWAVKKGLAEVVQMLIEAKVDVNTQGDEKWYPIHACFDNVDITRMLVAAGASVDVLSEPEPDPDWDDVRDYLYDSDDVRSDDSDSDDGEAVPSIWLTVKKGCGDVLDALLEAKPSRETLKAGLKAAIVFQRPEMAEKLLDHCPDASYLPDMDDLLHLVVKKPNNLAVLERLLRDPYKVDPNKRDSHGSTALHWMRTRRASKSSIF